MTSQSVLLWLLAWSAAATLLAWVLRPTWQPVAVIACGAAFLGQMSPTALVLLVVGTAGTYLAARRGPVTRRALLVGIALIAGTFIAFLLRAHHDSPEVGKGILPFGVAFFALRLIHYLFESFKGSLRPHSAVEYACYQFLPGALPAGPIHRFGDFQRDFRRRRWDAALFSEGLQRVLYGLVKIVVLADYGVGVLGSRKLAALSVGGPVLHAYLSTVSFWATLYLTFSGYSDVAVGLAGLLGVRLVENFRWPFVARNIVEFWQRWHFSLSSWCRDYVYTPVMASTRRQGFAVVVSMIVLGLWHEISLRYVLWGAYHAVGIALFRRFDALVGPAVAELSPTAAAGWRVMATLLTLHFVMLSFLVTSNLQRLLTGG